MQLVFDFSQWLISPRQGVVGRQYDNLSHSLVVEGELPSGYTWDMLVEAKGKYNIIPLSATATGATASLTADQLAFGNTYYAFQLRGTSGEIIHHTNAVQVYVPDTIVGPGTWPVLPTEFSAAEANIKELNAHPPVPGENGYWMLWDLDTHSYVQSQLVVPGLHIEIGETTTGEPGTPANVTNSGTNTAPVLNFTIPEGEKGDAATIQVGEVTSSDPGSEPQVTNSGTENAAVFDFVLPRGQTGPTGQAATIEVESTATGEPGSQASVTGDGPEYQINLGIPQGKTGETGAQGVQGEIGPRGYTFTPAVDDAGNLSWTNDGGLPNPEEINIKGPIGATGPQGNPGATPTITAGTVTTLDPGQDATAEITGETPNLTLNLGIPEGQPGQDGVQLNDDAVNTTEAWSSKKIIDTLCPPFSVSGNPVVCHPVEDYPLSAVVTLEPKQAGSGDPSLENVRPITGYDSVTVTQSKDEAQVKQITLILPETIYGGTVDAVSGVGEKTWAFVEFDGSEDENWHKAVHSSGRVYFFINIEPYGLVSDVERVTWKCNRLVPFVYNYASIEFPEYSIGFTSLKNTCTIVLENESMLSVDEFKAWLAENPVTVCYKLATPKPFQATGNQPLPAVAGLNTVYTDGDSLEVTGRQDLLYTLQTMQAQTQNLNRFIAEGGTQ